MHICLWRLTPTPLIGKGGKTLLSSHLLSLGKQAQAEGFSLYLLLHNFTSSPRPTMIHAQVAHFTHCSGPPLSSHPAAPSS